MALNEKFGKYKYYRAFSKENREFYDTESPYFEDEKFHDETYLDFWYSGNPKGLIGSYLPRTSVQGNSIKFLVYKVELLYMDESAISSDDIIIGNLCLDFYTTEQLIKELASRGANKLN